MLSGTNSGGPPMSPLRGGPDLGCPGAWGTGAGAGPLAHDPIPSARWLDVPGLSSALEVAWTRCPQLLTIAQRVM